MLSNAQLAKIKATVAKFYPQTCTITQEDDSRGDFGEMLHGEIVVASNVPCRVISAGEDNSGRNELAAERERIRQIYKISVPTTVTLGEDMRVTVDGVVYHVISIIDAWGDRVDKQAVIVRENG